MIIASLQDTKRFESLNPYFEKAFSYLKSLDLKSLEVGTHKIDGDNLYMNVVSTELKAKDAAPLETHNEYLDIQIPVSTAEIFGWSARENCKDISSPYSPEKDIEFYSDKPTTYFTIQPGEFAVFFPEDGHAPCIGSGAIKKIIIKVKA